MLIRKNTHGEFKIPKILEDPKEITCKVMFTDTCKYNLNSEDQMDINKLFGIGYFSWDFVYLRDFNIMGYTITLPWLRPMHHVNSVRFGWRYDPKNENKIEILAYWYDNTIRKDHSMGFIDIGKYYTFIIRINRGHHTLKVNYHYPALSYRFEVLLENKDIGYSLGTYFGGNNKAPHDMAIVISKY